MIIKTSKTSITMMSKIRNTLQLVRRPTTSSLRQLSKIPKDPTNGAHQIIPKWSQQMNPPKDPKMSTPKDPTKWSQNVPTKGSQNEPTKAFHQMGPPTDPKISPPKGPPKDPTKENTEGPHLSDHHDTFGFRQVELWLGNRLGAKIWKISNKSSGC